MKKLNSIMKSYGDKPLKTLLLLLLLCAAGMNKGFAYDFSEVNPLGQTLYYTIIDATNAEIVVSSSWRCEGIDFLREMWGDRNMPGSITGVTPRYGATYGLENRRGWEIEKYLKMLRQSENTQRKYVIIDDYDSFLPHQQEFFIHTDSDVGITEADAEKAIKILTMK